MSNNTASVVTRRSRRLQERYLQTNMQKGFPDAIKLVIKHVVKDFREDENGELRIIPLLLTCKLVMTTAIPILYSDIKITSRGQFMSFITTPAISSYRHVKTINISPPAPVQFSNPMMQDFKRSLRHRKGNGRDVDCWVGGVGESPTKPIFASVSPVLKFVMNCGEMIEPLGILYNLQTVVFHDESSFLGHMHIYKQPRFDFIKHWIAKTMISTFSFSRETNPETLAYRMKLKPLQDAQSCQFGSVFVHAGYLATQYLMLSTLVDDAVKAQSVHISCEDEPHLFCGGDKAAVDRVEFKLESCEGECTGTAQRTQMMDKVEGVFRGTVFVLELLEEAHKKTLANMASLNADGQREDDDAMDQS